VGGRRKRSLRIESELRSLRWQLASPEQLFFFLTVGIIVWQLFAPPIVGLADNGDYRRILHPLGLEHSATDYGEKYFGYLDREYVDVPRDPARLLTTQNLLAELALRIDRAFSRDDRFDLTIMGGTNLAFYLLGIYLILVAAGSFRGVTRYLLGVVLVVASTDVAQVAFFNSFYSESASLVFLVILIGLTLCYIRGSGSSLPYLLAILLAAALFIGAKPHNYPFAIPLALFVATLRVHGRRPVRRRLLFPLSLALVLFAALLFLRLPAELKACNRWNTVFTGVLVDSPDPRHDLAALGLDPSLAAFAGKSAFDEGVPVYDPGIELGYGRILRFYITHPGRLLALCRRGAEQALVRLPPDIGHFEPSAGRDWGAQSKSFSFWHRFQERFFPASLLFLVTVFVSVAGGALIAMGESRLGGRDGSLPLLFLFLAIMAPIAFLVAIVGDGCYEIPKHLFLFHALLDACLIAALAWVGSAVRLRFRLGGSHG